MLRLRHIRILPFIVLLFTATWLSLTPAPFDAPGPDLSDKVLHFIAYGAIAFTGYVAFPRTSWHFAGLIIVWSIGIELIQWQLPTRSFELLDILANSTGTCFGWIGAHLTMKLLHRLPHDK